MLYPDDGGGSLPILPILISGGLVFLVIMFVPSPNLSGAGENEDSNG